jgi:hypothetical protein
MSLIFCLSVYRLPFLLLRFFPHHLSCLRARSPMTPRAINYLILIAALCDSADRF